MAIMSVRDRGYKIIPRGSHLRIVMIQEEQDGSVKLFLCSMKAKLRYIYLLLLGIGMSLLGSVANYTLGRLFQHV
jgi:hypothetical protein